MRKLKNTVALLLSIVMFSGICSAMPSYAQNISSDVIMEHNVQQLLSVIEKRSQKNEAKSVTSVSTYEELNVALQAKANNIYLLQDIYLESTLLIDYDVSFLADPQGKTIYAAAGYYHIQITSSDIQLQFDNVILDGHYNKDINAKLFGGINADDVTDITLIGLNIQNCSSITVSNALADDNQSSFSLYNCIFRNNLSECTDIFSTNILFYNVLCEDNGGGIMLGTYETSPPFDNAVIANVLIYNTTIRNNTSNGLSLYNTETFLDSNTVIEGNSANSGAGIYASNSHIESYAAVKNNVSRYEGGGITLYYSTATIQGGEISYNIASNKFSDGANFGGGIAIETDSSNINGDVIINDGIIEGNIAVSGAGVGGGQMLDRFSPSYVIINGGIIRNNGNQGPEFDDHNNACGFGGGISAEKVKVTGGIIEQNHCLSSGAGICTNEFIMSGGLIQDNGYFLSEAGKPIIITSIGGGVCAYKNAIITDGLIYSNMAEKGGGIYIQENFSLTAPAYIRYNTAQDEGGGVYFSKRLDDNTGVDYSRIRNNIAPKGSQYFSV